MSLYIVDIHGELEGDYEEICKYEPCEDAVSREDAIRVIKSWFEKIELNPDILIDSIISLPSVQPTPENVEVWDGIHCQIVAPKGTFDKIYNEAEESEDAENI